MNKWDSKRIAFISILIAMSISFVIIGTRFAAVTFFPSFKLSLAGLPIKIIGYIFGPLVGFISGFTTDVISFIFMPAFYYPLYSIALGISGMLPGIAAIIFNKKISKNRILKRLNNKKTLVYYKMKLSIIKQNQEKLKYFEKKYEKLTKKIDKMKSWKKERYQLNYGLITSLVAISIVLITLISIFIFIPQEKITESFKDKGILQYIDDKIIFITIVALGIITCMIALVVFRFKMKPQTFMQFAAIVTFVIYTEFINIPIIAYADYKALRIDFMASMIGSLATSMIKIWFNLVIISFAIKIVLPIINKKTFNGYE
ncbi:MAG: hypothetical protein HDR43_02740 [Mycoplasma sp.]|nr:hypothetical protein [Mycoplasma sp.]